MKWASPFLKYLDLQMIISIVVICSVQQFDVSADLLIQQERNSGNF
jgi:hypothetical protein